MFKIMIIKEYYNLSDREAEDHVANNLKFMKFCGFSLSSRTPDHSTIANWRNHFIKLNIFEELFIEFNNQLKNYGIDIDKGAIVDATYVQSAARPKRKEYVEVEPIGDDILPEEEVNASTSSSDQSVSAEQSDIKYVKAESQDPDAKWSKKGNEFHYGYKAHTVTNSDGLITSVTTTPANEADCKQFQKSLDKVNLAPGSVVAADKGYSACYNREYLLNKGLKDNIMRKTTDKEVSSEFRVLLNRGISKIRFVVERTFGYLKLKLGFGRSRYIGLEKTHNLNIMRALTHNLIRSINML
jgi:IS5 family transposase